MSLRSMKFWLVVIVSCFVLATAYISVLTFERQAALQKVSRYNTAWYVSQSVSEFLRLEQRLAALGVEGSGVDVEEVRLRFDILIGRLETLQSGAAGDFLKQEPERLAVISDLTESMATVEAMLNAAPTSGTVVEALDILTSFERPLLALASAANHFGAKMVAEDQRELIQLQILFSALAGGLILCGIVLIILLLRHNTMLGKAQSSLKQLAEDLRGTSSELQLSNSHFDAALNNMSQGLCMVDSDGRLIVCNERFLELFDIPREHFSPGDVIQDIESGKCQNVRAFLNFYAHQRKIARQQRNIMFVQEHDDGRAFLISHQPLEAGGWVATYEDITERRQTERKLAYMAHYDTLTGLVNRNLLQEKLSDLLSHNATPAIPVAFFSLDLDLFKEVNDTLGHDIGDKLLGRVAQRLRGCADGSDIVARMGGDEFAILRDISSGPYEHELFAATILEAISQPYNIDGQEIVIGGSLGIALSDGSMDPEQLLKHADLALYRSKANGRGSYSLFQTEMDIELQARKTMEKDLRRALAEDQFEVFYQPIVNVHDEEICGFEALVRWNHPEHGYVPPAEFVPVAEDIGLISRISEIVLARACALAAKWPNRLSLAVNLSAIQFRSSRLVDTISEALATSGLAASRLELEITESILLMESEQTLAILHQLRDLGVRIAMDDFGTGYSSLSYLARFPFDKIKIDKSFVRDLDTRADSRSIIKLIAGLGRSLDICTTAEGVETEEQLEELRAAGCTEVQGYYFAVPKRPSELEYTLSETRREILCHRVA